jgi:DNA polymerase I-like protein with 3'-5' exonuclease and polymerase domains
MTDDEKTDKKAFQGTFAKRVNFGINYRQSSKGLGEVLGISMSEAQDLIDEYKATFPGIEKLCLPPPIQKGNAHGFQEQGR